MDLPSIPIPHGGACGRVGLVEQRHRALDMEQVLCANTLFCTPRHAELLARCSEAMAPRGTLLFDVYNAAPWHEEALYIAGGGSAEDGAEARQRAEGEEGGEEGEESGEEGGEEGGVGGELEEDEDVLVRAIDEAGRKWTVFERDPEVGRPSTCMHLACTMHAPCTHLARSLHAPCMRAACMRAPGVRRACSIHACRTRRRRQEGARVQP